MNILKSKLTFSRGIYEYLTHNVFQPQNSLTIVMNTNTQPGRSVGPNQARGYGIWALVEGDRSSLRPGVCQHLAV